MESSFTFSESSVAILIAFEYHEPRLSDKICEKTHIEIDKKKFEKGACLNFIKFVSEIGFVQVYQSKSVKSCSWN